MQCILPRGIWNQISNWKRGYENSPRNDDTMRWNDRTTSSEYQPQPNMNDSDLLRSWNDVENMHAHDTYTTHNLKILVIVIVKYIPYLRKISLN
jgi:hypothetical protein